MTRRSESLERLLLLVVGAALLLAGGYAFVRGLGGLGQSRADASLMSASTVGFLNRHHPWWWLVGTLLAILAAYLGYRLLRRQLRLLAIPTSRPLTRRGEHGWTRLEASAATDALEADLQANPDITGAAAAVLRSGTHPVLDLRLDITDDTDIADLRGMVEDHALRRFRQATEASELTAHIHLKPGRRQGHAVR